MEKGLRAVALYRASTKQQTDRINDDIPAQRSIVTDFINNNEWLLITEFTEGGVSGFKTPINERDALVKIKEMAVKGEFDVLVTYMSDRIGRIANETPLVIDFLNTHGVRVWSVTDGEIKADTHIDKLMTFLKFWQNEGESVKLSQRISDYHKQAVQSGKFRGGSYIPFGYKLVNKGSKNFKGRNILDLEIEPNHAEIVKLIFDLSVSKNYGQQRIAKHLNELGIKNGKGMGWGSSAIQYILNNPMYKGIMHMHSSQDNEIIYSPVQEHLIIIPEDIWNQNQAMQRQRKYAKEKKADYVVVDERAKVNNTHGKMLLSGLAFCGHCGEKLTTQTIYKRWTTKDGVKHKEPTYRYRCASFYKSGSKQCDGQSTYAMKKTDTKVLAGVKDFLINAEQHNHDEQIINGYKEEIELLTKVSNDTLKTITKFEFDLKNLKDEVVKSLTGESTYTQALLNELIQTTTLKIEDTYSKLKLQQEQIKSIELEYVRFISVANDMEYYNEKFDKMDIDELKEMLLKYVERVAVFRDKIIIDFRINVQLKSGDSIGCHNNQLVLTS